eukprot:142621_1
MNDHQYNNVFIINAGWGRTGTMSLRSALNRLGFKCYHFIDALQTHGHCEIWNNLCKQKLLENSDKLKEDYDWNKINKLLKDYKSGADAPIFLFYKELMEFYPNSKVLLTVRDGENWYKSYRNLWIAITATNKLWFIKLLWKDFKFKCKLSYNISRILFGDDFDNALKNDKDFCIKRYNEWNKGVIEYVPENRLLVFNVKQGWPSLCKFLNITEIPTEPFPHINESSQMKKATIFSNILVTVVNVSLVVIPVIVGYIYWKRHHK